MKIEKEMQELKEKIIQTESNIITMAISKYFEFHKNINITEHEIKYNVYDPAEFFNKYPKDSEQICIINFEKGKAVLDINTFPFIKNDFLALEDLLTKLTSVIIFNSLNRLDRIKLKRYGYSPYINYISMKVAINTMKNIHTSFKDDYKKTNERQILAKKILDRYNENNDISIFLYGLAILENSTIKKDTIFSFIDNCIDSSNIVDIENLLLFDFSLKDITFSFKEIKENDKIISKFKKIT